MSQSQKTLPHPLALYLVERAMTSVPQKLRNEERHPLSIPIMVHPLDANLDPIDKEFRAITKDISDSGLSFVYSEPIAFRLLRIRLPDHVTSMIVEVKHCSPIGGIGLLYLIGAKFTGLKGAELAPL